MSAFLKPRVLETSATTGTGTFQLLGAVQGYSTFVNAFGNGASCYYGITLEGSTQFEYGFGTINAASQLTRSLVLGSSAGNAVVDWSEGTKLVACAVPPTVCMNNGSQVFLQGDTTPSVAAGSVWKDFNSSTITITNFTDGIDGQVITIIFFATNTTIQHNSTIKLSGGSNFAAGVNDVLRLVQISGVWYEVSRSVGNA